jgi:signal transduction histidine kinase
MNFWNSLTGIGTEYAVSPSERRSVYLANAISLVLSTIGYSLFIIYYFWYGWSVITVAIPFMATFCLMPLLLNLWGQSVLSRIWVCLFVPITTMALSIYSKTVYYERQEELDYFTFRIIILSGCVFPPVFFSIKEKFLLFLTSATILLILMMHDPLHGYFNVPYRTINMKESNYAFTNVVVLMMYLLMTGAVIFMKWVSEMNEGKAQALIEELNTTNSKLHEKNNEVELRNQEILDQTERLNMSRQKLTDAYKIIEEQRNLLYQQNKNLSTELIEKNKELTETNNELIKHNNELRQFSYTVSHNLRGPVASLMGLLKLFQIQDFSEENAEIFQHVESSTLRLDNIIKDLSKIIDIRHDIFHIRQQISLEHEINEILEVLNREIESNNISLNINLGKCGIIYSVRPMVHSILYNLISNAIKYRSPERNSKISITSSEDEKYYIIEVMDNGLGIDMNRDKDNLFKLYKRFHHHTEGKGLGLYLVKLQAEALGGSISVSSELNRQTTFTVKLKKPENAERQILHQEDYAEIFYDARLNCIGTLWMKKVSVDEYVIVARKVIDFISAYNTPNYLADLSVQHSLFNADVQPVFLRIIPEAAKNGLLRIAAIIPGDATITEKPETISMLFKHNITLGVFRSAQEAVEWIGQSNSIASQKIRND